MVILCSAQGQVAVPLVGKNMGHLRIQVLQEWQDAAKLCRAGRRSLVTPRLALLQKPEALGAHFHLQMGLLKQNSQVHSSNK